MAKEFKDWVDEFVENGANPKDVTNWPEEGGGGSTVIANPELSGTEADLTGLQVGDSKYKVTQGPNIITVAYIDRLTNEQCQALRCGDIVIEDSNGQLPKPKIRTKHTFVVTSIIPTTFVGQKPTIYLSRQEPVIDATINCQAVVYTFDNEQWSCTENSFFNLHQPVEPEVTHLEGTSGNIEWDYMLSICEEGYCFINGNNGIMAIISGVSYHEEGNLPVLSTAVYQGKYYTVTFKPVAPEDPDGKYTFNYTVNEVQVGGGGIEFVKIDIEATSINQETLNKLVDFNNQTLKTNFIVLTTKNETDTYPILMPSDNVQYVYRSAVMDGKYYQLSLHIYEEPTGANINIEQISVGGEEIINLTFDTTKIDLDTAEKLTGSNKNNYIIELNNNTETSPGIYLHPNGEYTNSWTSNIIDDSYWEFRITDWQEEGIYVSIQEISVGGKQEPTFNFRVSSLSTSSSGELSADNPIIQWLQALAEEGVETASAKVNIYIASEDREIGTYILLTLAKAYISSRGEVTFSTIIGGDGVYSYTLYINSYLASQWYYHFNVNTIVAPGPK